MRNYKKYRSAVLDLFQSFLAEKIDKNDLIINLQSIELELINGKKTLKGFWFRFFNGNTGVNTILDLYCGIGNATNDKYYRECMQISIDNPKELKIYYS